MSEVRMVQFFDEMNLLQSEKSERLETAQTIKSGMQEFFDNQLNDLVRGFFMALKTSDEYVDDLIALYLAFADSDDRYMQEKAVRWANEVENTTENVVLNNERYHEFEEALETGNKVTDVPEQIQNVFSEDRAERIGLQESNVIHNYRRHLEIAKAQYTHTWETMRDERVRLHHAEADGQTVPVDEPFVVMGEELMFPGDDSLGASAGNILNCRCLEI